MLKILAGDLDRRIRLWRLIGDVDAGGDPNRTSYSAIQEVHASFTPIDGAEIILAGKETARVKAEFIIRYSATASTLKAQDQIEFESERWDIISVLPVGRQHWLKITAMLRRAD